MADHERDDREGASGRAGRPARRARAPFPEAPGTTKPGDPPIEEPQGERSRHGGGGHPDDVGDR